MTAQHITCQDEVEDQCARKSNIWSYKTYNGYRIEFPHPYGVYPTSKPVFFYENCELTDIHATANTIFKFKTNSDTLTLSATNCNLPTIPNGLFEQIMFLDTVSLIRVGMTQLKSQHFNGAHRLTILNLSSNKIEELEPNVFQSLSSVKSIDLSNNNISTIDRNAFSGVDSLAVVFLNNNSIATFNCGFGSNIKALRLNHNRIVAFEPDLAASTVLTELELSENMLTTLNESLRIDYAQMARLDISNNPLKVIMYDAKFVSSEFLNITNTSASTCYISKTTQVLDASFNRIRNIVVNDADHSPIEELLLSHNQLTLVHNLTKLKYLKKLDLSFNAINDIGFNTFANMVELRILKLENSGLKTIDFGTFSHQRTLVELDISFNRLGNIDFNMLLFQRRIQLLHIGGNDLTTLNATDLMSIFPGLEQIGLSDNQFNCSYLTEILKVLNDKNVNVIVTNKVTNTTNVKGMGCHKNSKDLNTWSLPPIHMSNHTEAFEVIEEKINNIIRNVKVIGQRNDSLTRQQYQWDITGLRQQLMQIKNDMDLKLMNQKSDIILTVAQLFDDSNNRSDEYATLNYQMDNNRRVALERFQTLSERLNSITQLIHEPNKESINLPKMDALVHDDDHKYVENNKVESNGLSSLVIMIGITLVVFAVLFIGIGYVIRNRNKYFIRRGRRSMDTGSVNTINTSI